MHPVGRRFDSYSLHHHREHMEKRTVKQEDTREVHDLGEHIILFDNYFSNEFCEDCIAIFDDAEASGLVVGRNNSGLSIKDQALIHTQIPASSLPLAKHLVDIINYDIIPEFLKKYDIASQYDCINVGGAKMQKTLPTEGYHVWHMEHSNQMDSYRSICAWALFLNDVEEGGELEFLYQSKRIKPKKGDFVLWPAGYTHHHRGNPPLQGVKYIYTGWLDTL